MARWSGAQKNFFARSNEEETEQLDRAMIARNKAGNNFHNKARMPPKGWQTKEQKAFFTLWMPEFLVKKAAKNLDGFWNKMKQAWFQEFPEELELNLPVQVFDPDPNVPHPRKLTEDEEALLGDAITARNEQLRNAFFNSYAKIRKQRGGVSRSTSGLAAMLFKQHPKRKRRHQVLEVYQQQHKTTVKAALQESEYVELNEAAQRRTEDGEWIDDADDEEKAARLSSTRKKRMEVQRRVVRECWEAEDEAVQEEVRKKTRTEVRVKPSEDEDPEDGQVPQRTPEEYQMSLDESMQVAEIFLTEFARMTGWVGALVYAGPVPRLGGDLGFKSYSFGLDAGGVNFENFHSNWKKGVVNPLCKFARKAIPRETRTARAIEKPADEQEQDESASEGTVAEQPPRRPRKSNSKSKSAAAKGPKKRRTPTSSLPHAPSPSVDPCPVGAYENDFQARAGSEDAGSEDRSLVYDGRALNNYDSSGEYEPDFQARAASEDPELDYVLVSISRPARSSVTTPCLTHSACPPTSSTAFGLSPTSSNTFGISTSSNTLGMSSNVFLGDNTSSGTNNASFAFNYDGNDYLGVNPNALAPDVTTEDNHAFSDLGVSRSAFSDSSASRSAFSDSSASRSAFSDSGTGRSTFSDSGDISSTPENGWGVDLDPFASAPSEESVTAPPRPTPKPPRVALGAPSSAFTFGREPQYRPLYSGRSPSSSTGDTSKFRYHPPAAAPIMVSTGLAPGAATLYGSIPTPATPSSRSAATFAAPRPAPEAAPSSASRSATRGTNSASSSAAGPATPTRSPATPSPTSVGRVGGAIGGTAGTPQHRSFAPARSSPLTAPPWQPESRGASPPGMTLPPRLRPSPERPRGSSSSGKTLSPLVWPKSRPPANEPKRAAPKASPTAIAKKMETARAAKKIATKKAATGKRKAQEAESSVGGMEAGTGEAVGRKGKGKEVEAPAEAGTAAPAGPALIHSITPLNPGGLRREAEARKEREARLAAEYKANSKYNNPDGNSPIVVVPLPPDAPRPRRVPVPRRTMGAIVSLVDERQARDDAKLLAALKGSGDRMAANMGTRGANRRGTEENQEKATAKSSAKGTGRSGAKGKETAKSSSSGGAATSHKRKAAANKNSEPQPPKKRARAT
ncbi:hypothetical protein C8F04DRAFT_1178830 [Mycena alexandri]|uniref:Uncharacterized protein n=1 Tax=Mycena alexandri TaxID=1745969 RepID=A0AAD6T5M3_9AGAR|nr:hypothetical protein C8F04DRAFT_1178830 [Mycena alexandri]